MSTLLTIVLPLLLVVLTGYIAGAGKWLDIAAARTLSRFVFMFAMPIAILNFYTKAPPPGLELVPFLTGYFLAMISIIALAAWTGFRLLDLDIRQSGAHAFVSTCGNAVFLGLPIALQVEGWGQPFLMLMILEGIFVFGIATTLMGWKSDERENRSALSKLTAGIVKSSATPFRNPIVLASIAGVLIAYSGVTFPTPVNTFLNTFGPVAGPTGLFVLGLYIATLPREGVKSLWSNIAAASAVKLLVFPVIAGLVVYIFTGADMRLTGAVVLFTCMPPAVASLVQASHYRIYERETAVAVSVASILSLLTLTIVLLIFA
ncbi:AEC family transporter [Parvularcula sp. IMCC14364]|uniref:AEC family transporter n=1 Tax=Parvularcula sp. IMCC14364 TaxID=3067902 RepID=UPI00274215C3|nr:AEC family transporter [Parvularcula sp. IMCC14364]